MRTAYETTILVARLLRLAGVKRARISEATIRKLSERRYLRRAFLEALAMELEDRGLHLMELERGGFGLIFSDSLAGAPAVTAKRYMSDDLKKLRAADRAERQRMFEQFEAEIEGSESADGSDE